MSSSSPRRRLPLWLPAAGAFVGATVLAVRLATVPLDQTSPVVAVVVLGAAVALVALTVRAFLRRARVRSEQAANPGALVMPIVGGVGTAAATRWLAERLGDPLLALRPDRQSLVAFDAEGLRLGGSGGWSAPIPTARLEILPIAETRVGAREVDALVIGIDTGDVVAPLPLVPARTSLFTIGMLSDDELLEVSARIREAWAGTADPGGWEH